MIPAVHSLLDFAERKMAIQFSWENVVANVTLVSS